MRKSVGDWLAVAAVSLVALMMLPANARHDHQSEAGLILDGQGLSERSCYFEGKSYSEGAELEDSEGTIRCGVLDGVTQNGALGWLREGQGKEQIESRQDESGRVIEIRKN